MITKKTKIIFSLLLLFFIFLSLFIFQKNRIKYDKLNQLDLSITPEYLRNLTELTLTIPKGTTSKEETLQILNDTYANLLLNIPAYTKLNIFTHTDNKELLYNFFASLKIPNEVIYHLSDDKYLEIWAQDYFEPVKNENFNYYLLPTTTKSSAFGRIEQRNASFKNFDKSLTAPFFFEGGNLLAAKSILGDFVFIDFDSIKKTQDLYQLNGKMLSENQIANLVQETFPNSKVVVLGDKRREKNFIHLDQSILFLEDNIVVINSIEDAPESEAAKQHQLYKKQLETLGFDIKLLPISIKDVENLTSPLNAIAFKNSLTNRKTIIFPVYPEEINDLDKQKSSLEKDDLKGNALEAFILFSESGYLPIPVFDNNLFKKGGSLHCISNVIR